MYHFYVLTLSTRLYFLCLWHLFFVSERHPVGSCRSVIMRKNLDILFQEYKKNTQDLQARNCQASLNSCACECTDNTSPFFPDSEEIIFYYVLSFWFPLVQMLSVHFQFNIPRVASRRLRCQHVPWNWNLAALYPSFKSWTQTGVMKCCFR